MIHTLNIYRYKRSYKSVDIEDTCACAMDATDNEDNHACYRHTDT